MNFLVPLLVEITMSTCYLLLCNKLSQTRTLKKIGIYYLTYSVGQKSGGGMAG